MTRLTNRAILAAALFGAFSLTQAAPAVAQGTLLDLLRGGPGKSTGNKPRDAKPLWGGNSGVPGVIAGDVDPEPLPKISGPRYYTYQPDALRLVKTAGFSSVDAASADAMPVAMTEPASTGSIGAYAEIPRAAMASVKVYATGEVAEALEAYYGSGKPLLWVGAQGVNDKANAMIAALAAADEVGLDAADYVVELPATGDATVDGANRDEALMRFELALSSKALSYIQDTARGRVDPNKLSGYHDFKRKPVNLKPVLNMLRLSPDVAAYLRSRDPSNEQFLALKAELARLRAEDAAAGAQIAIAPGLLLKPAQSNGELANVVALIGKNGSEALKAEHAATLAAYQGAPDYAPEIVALVEAFQKEAGLKPDGVIGPATVRALTGHSNGEKIAKLIVAMEQLRWLPDDLGARYVFINQPAYQAYYVNDGKEQVSMRVVVGSRANQTYFFQDQIETVEVNPYWGVPQSIIVNEMLPKLRQDPGYLDRLGYEVSYRGRQVASSSVDWNTTHSVDVRQPPGGGNALGELKILFPNAHSIYMHDTPQKSFFQRDMRALSHGCVRLAEPRVMAAAVMGTTVEEIGRQIAQGQNKALPVPHKIPVYVSYFTAWPKKDGTIAYYDDVYGRDDYTAKAFAATTKARAAQS